MIEKNSEKYQQICKMILQVCDEKEKLGIEHLHNSDLYEVQVRLDRQHIRVSYKDVSDTLEMLLE